MLKSFFGAVTAALVIVAMAQPALAKKGGGAKAAESSAWDKFKTLDKDADGKISLEEFKQSAGADQAAQAEEKFKKLDTNNDGNVSYQEFQADEPAATPMKKAHKKKK